MPLSCFYEYSPYICHPQNPEINLRMSLAQNLCCTIFGHNLTITKSKGESKITHCSSCDLDFKSNLFEDINLLNDVQLEMKQTIRELFIITHRRRRHLKIA
jgi:hypothetical protein